MVDIVTRGEEEKQRRLPSYYFDYYDYYLLLIYILFLLLYSHRVNFSFRGFKDRMMKKVKDVRD